jgi:hypothetical protein
MMRFIITFARYMAATIVAFVISMIVFILFAAILLILDSGKLSESIALSVYVIALVGGAFSGVLVGSMCLQQTSRWEGSIILLVLGLAFYINTVLFMEYPEIQVTQYFLGGLGLLALGGSGAVILFFRRRPKTPSS